MACGIILVHGTGHGAWCWDRVVEGLRAQGLAAVAVDLPGRGVNRDRPRGAEQTLAVINEAVDAIGGPVVLVGHSSAGGPVSRVAQDNRHVRHLVYLSALLPTNDESMVGVIEELIRETSDRSAATPDGVMIANVDNAIELMYHDCTAEEGRRAYERLIPEPVDVIHAEAESAKDAKPWQTVETTYLICTQDRSVSQEVQRRLASRVHHVIELPTSHSPFLSRPELVVDILAKIAASDGPETHRKAGERTLAATAHAEVETRLPRALPEEELTWMPAWRIREDILAKKLSPVEVLDHFLCRIETHDPQLNAFHTIDHEGARDQARAAEQAVMKGEALGPFLGIPVATKLPLAIKGMPWADLSAGGLVQAEQDSMEIERLRGAGAIILGPTAAGIAAPGVAVTPIRNPWDINRTCGISSGGSACAISGGMVPLSIGGDGYGSTRLPAAFCGVVGLHQTRGRVPSFEWGTLNSRPFTTYGPMTRDIRDAATVLSVLAGPDGRDLMCLQDDPPDYLAGLDEGARGMRLCWTDDFGYVRKYAVTETERVISAVRAAAARLQEVGATIEAPDLRCEEPIWAANQWTAMDPATMANDVLHFDPPSRAAMKEAREVRRRVWEQFRGLTEAYDFIISPTILEVAPTLEEWARNGLSSDFTGIFVAMTAVANFLGWPAISVPAGLVDGMPVALQILGRPNSEPRIFQLAQSFLRTRG